MCLLLVSLCAGDKLGGLVPNPVELYEFLFCILHWVGISSLRDRCLIGSSKIKSI